jgi:glycerate-2-kinase
MLILSEAARRIWEAAIAAVEPRRLVGRAVALDGDILRVQDRAYDLGRTESILLAAFGKAAPAMAEGFLDRTGDRVKEGLVVALPGSAIRAGGLAVFEAPHPLPDRRSVAAAEAVLGLARRAGENDLLVLLVSGGGSAMLCAPADGLSLEDKMAVNRELIRRGADIFELNAVRKHLSSVKGGRLAQAAVPAAVMSLALSDVPGDDPGTIASGPAWWDETRFADAARVLEKYGLWKDGPPAVRRFVAEGLAGLRPETPKRGHPAFRLASAHVLGSNATALAAATEAARSLGFKVVLLPGPDRGEAREAARRYASILRSAAVSEGRAGEPVCLLGGGELTVTVRGKGRGGRNQEFVLAAAEALEAWGFLGGRGAAGPEWLVASLGTDGLDGGTDAAGAWAGPETLLAARRLGLRTSDYLDDNDSHGFFRRTGGLIMTGPTGTNVMDVRLLVLQGRGENHPQNRPDLDSPPPDS